MKKHEWIHTDGLTSVCKDCNKSVSVIDIDYMEVIYSNDCPEVITYDVNVEDIKGVVSRNVLRENEFFMVLHSRRQRDEVLV